MHCPSGRHHRAVLLWALVAISLLTRTSLPADDAITLFETRIRPVLVEQCQECHRTDGAAEGGLVLDHREGMRVGGAGGAILVPGAPESSRLLAILRHELPGLEMPQGGKRLDDDTLAAFTAWIAAGAPDPREPPAAGPIKAPIDFAERRTWWSYQPLRKHAPPQPARADWSDNPIDHFVAARLDAAP
jgi:cytochrome c553